MCNLQVSLEGVQWNFERLVFPKLSDSGTGDVHVRDTTIILVLNIGVLNGKPSFSVASTEVQVGKCDLKLSGSAASWAYNIAAVVLNNQLKGMISDALEQAVESVVATEVLSTMNELTSLLFPVLKPPPSSEA